MSNVEKLLRPRTYSTIRIGSGPDGNSHWMYMHAEAAPGTRPCFHSQMLDDVLGFLDSVTLPRPQRQDGKLRHVVVASDASAFNLGGDLELFARLIRAGDRAQLLSYATRCVNGVHQLNTGLGGDVRTIALVQGDALGGGLEIALSCHTIVAEEGVDMGLPEVLFGLFPGMGAYSFLCKRVPPRVAEKIILDGHIYSSDELHKMGVVDVLAPKGQGAAAVQELIARQQRAAQAHLALNACRNLAQPVSHAELMAITEVWVDAALALGDKSLKMMERIVRAQERRAAGRAAA